MKEIIASVVGIVIGAGVFSVLCLIFDAPSHEHLLFSTSLGAFTGLLAAPEFSPESFRHPKTFQVLSGIGIGFSVGVFLKAPVFYLVALCVVGALIGYFAKQFIECVYVP